MEKEKLNFEQFAQRVKTHLTLINKNKSVSGERTVEDIKELLLTHDGEQLRELSNDFYFLSGLYRRALLYFSTLLTYDTLIVPTALKENAGKDIVTGLNNATQFLDDLHLEKELARIMLIVLRDGVYYGFFKECSNGKYLFQDLDANCCRTRFKSANDLPVLEFDLSSIDNFIKEYTVDNLNAIYPAEIVQAYRRWKRNKGGKDSQWIMVNDGLGVVFYFNDVYPLLVSMTQAIAALDDYKGLEKALDEKDLKKILLEQIPMKDGELLFTLDEATSLHNAILDMLSNNPDVDVLTTFCDTKMLDTQDRSQANRDNLEKMERSVYNEAGISKNLFASEGSTALQYSITNDTALVINVAKIFEPFLNFVINKKYATKKVFFGVSILPITHYNRKEMFDLYLKGAQYGYSKMLPGIASGVSQHDLLNLITLENDYMGLAEKMKPLQSSHTTSGADLEKKQGAPAKDDREKSDKTRQNEESL